MNGVSEDKMIDMVKKEWNQLIFVIFAIFAFFDYTNSEVEFDISEDSCEGSGWNTS